MEKKDPFREFIEGLSQLNGLEDPDVKAADNALAVWITKHYPRGFDYDRRDLAISMVKKSAEIIVMIRASPFRAYIDAMIDMKWKKMSKELEAKEKAGKKINRYDILIKFAEEAFSLGYALRSLEEKSKEKK